MIKKINFSTNFFYTTKLKKKQVFQINIEKINQNNLDKTILEKTQNLDYDPKNSWQTWVWNLRELVVREHIKTIAVIAGHRDIKPWMLTGNATTLAKVIAVQLTELGRITNTKVVFGGIPILGSEEKRSFIDNIHKAMWSMAHHLQGKNNVIFFPCTSPGESQDLWRNYFSPNTYTWKWRAVALFFLGRITSLNIHNLWTPHCRKIADEADRQWLCEIVNARASMRFRWPQ